MDLLGVFKIFPNEQKKNKDQSNLHYYTVKSKCKNVWNNKKINNFVKIKFQMLYLINLVIYSMI